MNPTDAIAAAVQEWKRELQWLECQRRALSFILGDICQHQSILEQNIKSAQKPKEKKA